MALSFTCIATTAASTPAFIPSSSSTSVLLYNYSQTEYSTHITSHYITSHHHTSLVFAFDFLLLHQRLVFCFVLFCLVLCCRRTPFRAWINQVQFRSSKTNDVSTSITDWAWISASPTHSLIHSFVCPFGVWGARNRK